MKTVLNTEQKGKLVEFTESESLIKFNNNIKDILQLESSRQKDNMEDCEEVSNKKELFIMLIKGGLA